MSVSAVEATPGIFSAGGPSTTPALGNSQDKDLFLKLMVAQMRYQDPSNPTDSGEFLAQSAQFTALEKMQAVADQTSQLVALQVAFGAAAMVGKTVSYPAPDGTSKVGTVSSCRFEATGPVLQVDGSEVPLASVLAIGDGSTDLAAVTPVTTG